MSDVNVKVGLSGDKFKSGLDKLKGDLAGFRKDQESAFGGLGNKLAGAFSGAVSIGAIVQFGKSMIELGSNINDTADQVQLSTDAFQELTYAFGQNGTDAETATKGLQKLAENLETARGGNEKMVASFARLGVTWEDLNSLSPEEILARLADGFAEIEDPAAAVSLSLDLMGKAGSKMAVTLRQGSDELARLRGEASKLSREEVEALDKAGDQIDAIVNKVKVAEAKGFSGLMQILTGGEGQAENLGDRVKNLFRPVTEGPATAAELDMARARVTKGKEDRAAAAAVEPAPVITPMSPEAKREMEDDFALATARRKDLQKQVEDGNKLFLKAEEEKKEKAQEAAEAAQKAGDKKLQADVERAEKAKRDAKEVAAIQREAEYETAAAAISMMALTDEEAAKKAQIALIERQIADNLNEAVTADQVRLAEIEKQNLALIAQKGLIERGEKLRKAGETPEERRQGNNAQREKNRVKKLVDARERDKADVAKRNGPNDLKKLFGKPEPIKPGEIQGPPMPKADATAAMAANVQTMTTALAELKAAIEQKITVG